MMKHTTCIIIALIVSLCNLSAQDISLETCKLLALQNNVSVKNAMLDVDAAREVKSQVLTKYFPNVTAMAGGYYALKPLVEYGIEDVDNAALRNWLHNLYFEYGAGMGFPNKLSFCENGMVVGASVMQPVFMGGQIVNGNKLASVGVKAAEVKDELAREQVLRDIEENYWLVVSLYEKRKTLLMALEFLDTLYRDAENASQAGLISRNDPLKVVIKQNEMRSNLLKVDNGIALATMALCQAVGMEYTPTVHLTDTLEEDAVVGLAKRLHAPVSAGQRKEALLLDLNVNAEQLKKKMSIGETLPHLMVGAGASYGNLIFDDYSANGLAFATLQVPLTDWWETSHKIRQHNYAIRKAENERTDLTQKMLLEMQQTWYGVQEALAQMELTRATLTDAEANLQATHTNYLAGLVPVSELLEAQALYQQSQNQVIDALIDLQIKCNRHRILMSD